MTGKGKAALAFSPTTDPRLSTMKATDPPYTINAQFKARRSCLRV